LQGFLAEVADEISSNDGLNVGREATAAGLEIERLVYEVHRDAAIDEFAEFRPVTEVPGAPVNLVDQDSFDLTLTQEPEHFCPLPPSALCGCLPFLKPARDLEAVPLREACDRGPLFLQRDVALALARGRDADIGVEHHGS